MFLLRRGDENRRQFLPILQKPCLESLHIAVEFGLGDLVCLGEDNAEWHLVVAKPLNEAKVVVLRLNALVDEDEGAHQITPAGDVVVDHYAPLLACLFRVLGIAITGKVDEIPRIVDAEMVDGHCLARHR